MTAENQDFVIYGGNDLKVDVTVKDPAEVVIDLTGSSVKWQVKKHLTDVASVITKATGSGIVITDAINGVLQITIVPADTESLSEGIYFHEVEVADPGGSKFTVTVGKMTLHVGVIT